MIPRVTLQVNLIDEVPRMSVKVKPFTEVIRQTNHPDLDNLDFDVSGHINFQKAGQLPFVQDEMLMIWNNQVGAHLPSGIRIIGEAEIPQSVLDTLQTILDDLSTLNLTVAGLDFLERVDYDPITHTWTFTDRAGTHQAITVPADNFLANVTYNPLTKMITFAMSDGSSFLVDIRDLIDVYSVLEEGGLGLNVNKFYILSGGVTLDMLNTDVGGHFATKNELATVVDDVANAGFGDMLKSRYDKADNVGDLRATFEPVVAASATTNYFNGNKAWADFGNSVRSSLLTGFNPTNTIPTAANNFIDALSMFQGQMYSKANTARVTASELNKLDSTSKKSGIYTVASGTDMGLDLGYWHIFHSQHTDINGYNAQLAIPLNGTLDLLVRNSFGTTWSAWKSLISSLSALSEDEKIKLGNFGENPVYLKGFTTTFTGTATTNTITVENTANLLSQALGFGVAITRARKVVTFSTTTITSVVTYYNSAAVQIETATQVTTISTLGSVIT